MSTHVKQPNVTSSAPYSELLSIEAYHEMGYARLRALLGNNGAITLNPLAKPGTLRLGSTVQGTAATDDVASGLRFPFTLELTSSEGSPISGEFVAVIEGSGTIDGQTITDGETRLTFIDGRANIELSAPASIEVQGLPAGSSYRITAADLSDRGYQIATNGATTGEINSGPEGTVVQQVDFTHIKNYTPVAIIIPGSVSLTGRDAKAEEFSFQLFNSDGTEPITVDGKPVIARNQSALANENAPFDLRGPSIEQPGDYTYTARQVTPRETPQGLTYDTRTYTIDVRIETDKQGVLSIANMLFFINGSEQKALHFMNTYTPAPSGGDTENPNDETGKPSPGPNQGHMKLASTGDMATQTISGFLMIAVTLIAAGLLSSKLLR